MLTLASNSTGRSLYWYRSGVPLAVTYEVPTGKYALPPGPAGTGVGLLPVLLLMSRVTYHCTTLCRLANSPLWKYGAVSATLRRVGTLNTPHSVVVVANERRGFGSFAAGANGPHSPMS